MPDVAVYAVEAPGGGEPEPPGGEEPEPPPTTSPPIDAPTPPAANEAGATPLTLGSVETSITAGPDKVVRRSRAKFRFSATRADAAFFCSLDGSPFSACDSPHRVRVGRGKHHFDVAAVAGYAFDLTPATFTWKRRGR